MLSAYLSSISFTPVPFQGLINIPASSDAWISKLGLFLNRPKPGVYLINILTASINISSGVRLFFPILTFIPCRSFTVIFLYPLNSV